MREDGLADALAVDEHAVEAAVVEHDDHLAARGDDGVAAGDREVLEHHVGADPTAEAQGASLADGRCGRASSRRRPRSAR